MQPMALVEALCSEVIRKLRLASEAESKDDREIVCEEVFCDVTGRLDEAAQAQLGAPHGTPFYVVLARHYATPRGADSAIAVLHLLQSLYGQGYAAPLVALLLHRWLLIRRAPGRGLPEEQRTRVANALALGSAQLFMGDVHGGAKAFEPLWRSLTHEVILGAEAPVWGGGPATPTMERHGSWIGGLSGGGASGSGGGAINGLGTLSLTARTSLLAVAAAFLVYYAPVEELEDLLKWFPAPTAPPAPSVPLAAETANGDKRSGSPGRIGMGSGRLASAGSVGGRAWESERQRIAPLASPPFHGVDFIMMEVVDILGRISTESGLVLYVKALQRLRGQPALVHPDGMRLGTRLKLQSTLTSLAAPGGPRYYPYAVGVQALEALDSLFPTGLGSRRLVRAMFKLLHPADWIGDVLTVPLGWVRAALSQLLLAAFRVLHSLVLWGSWRSAPRAQRELSPPASSAPLSRAPSPVAAAPSVSGLRWRGPSATDGPHAVPQPALPPRAEVVVCHTVAGDEEGFARSGSAPPVAALAADGSASALNRAPVRTRGGTCSSQPPSTKLFPLPSPRSLSDTPRADASALTEQLNVGMWVVPEPVKAAAVQSLVDALPVADGDGTSDTADFTGPSSGSWLAAGAERARLAAAAVGSTVTAVESRVKAMGAYASRLAAGMPGSHTAGSTAVDVCGTGGGEQQEAGGKQVAASVRHAG